MAAGRQPRGTQQGEQIRRGRSPLLPQACHELVPPETLAPVLRQLVDQFVHDRWDSPAIRLGRTLMPAGHGCGLWQESLRLLGAHWWASWCLAGKC